MSPPPRRVSWKHPALAYAVLSLALGTVTSLVQAQSPDEAVGFTPNHVFSGDSAGEYIDNQNGILNLTVPIGPRYQVGPRLSYQLSLHYASFIWVVVPVGSGSESQLRRDGPFGVGWDLHMGRIEPTPDAGISSGIYDYISPDGSRHPISTDDEITVDGTYIKAVQGANDWWLYFADGTSAHFLPIPDESPDGDLFPLEYEENFIYRLVELRAPEEIDEGGQLKPAAWVHVDYGQDVTGSAGQEVGDWNCIAQITDSLNRQISFTNVYTAEGGRTTAIQLPTAPGTSGTWTLGYLTDQSLHSPDSALPDVIEGRDLLETITLPDPPGPAEAPVFEFGYNNPDASPPSEETYHWGYVHQRYLPREVSTGLTLHPYYEYTYGTRSYRVVEQQTGGPVLTTHYGLALEQKNGYFLETDSQQIKTWTWSRFSQNGIVEEVEVLDPDGNVILYEFVDSTDPGADWRHGLLEKTTWFAGSEPNTRTELRQESREYHRGTTCRDLPVEICPIEVSETVRKLESENGFVDVKTQRLNFDPYGRPSDVIVEAPGRGLYRRVQTAWDAPAATPTPAAPWVLGTWSERVVYDGRGREFSKTDATFSPTGLLQSATRYKEPSGTIPGGDVTTTHQYDVDTDPDGEGWGVRTQTTLTGGDEASSYSTTYEYQDNTYLARAWTVGLATEWYSVNRDFDTPSGRLLRSMDPNDELPSNPVDVAGHPTNPVPFPFETTYQWDELGRLIEIRPPGQPAVEIMYTNLWETEVKQCATDPGDCRISVYVYDRQGRLEQERRTDENGDYNARNTAYDWADRITSRSEWYECTPDCDTPSPPVTLFDYVRTGTTKIDPFGRPWKITAPDLAETSFGYTDLERSTTVAIHTSQGTASSTTTWSSDAFGRLVGVDAPLGADAIYQYDLSDRLIRAELTDPDAPATTQVRSFTYDGLGRLRSSATPEGGTVQVLKYDAAGHPLETRDARGRLFRNTYDLAGRTVETRELRDGGYEVVVSRSTYDVVGASYDPNHPTLGKLVLTEAFDEWKPADPASQNGDDGIPVVTTRFEYLEPTAGRLSGQRTTFAAWVGRLDEIDFDPEIPIDYTYDAWGDVASIGYPNPFFGLPRSLNQVATVSYTRSNGWLAQIYDSSRSTTLLDVDEYNAAGGAQEWRSGNDVLTQFLPDSQLRLSQIRVQGPEPSPGAGRPMLWDSGTYQYDDAGNIQQIGNDLFNYDLLGRLTHASINFDDGGGMATYIEDYTYDGFGNLTTKMQSGAHSGSLTLTINERTNRIEDSQGAYSFSWDPAGNLIEDPTMFEEAGNPDPVGVLHFDGRGRLAGIARREDPTAAASWAEEFLYDAGGLRVVGVDAETGIMTFYVRDIFGQVLSEFTKPADEEAYPVWKQDTFYGLGGTIAVAEAEKPGPPGQFRAAVTEVVAGTTYDVALSWLAPQDGGAVTEYQIYRMADGESGFTLHGTVSGATYQWADQAVPWALYYKYYVLGLIGQDAGEPSRRLRITPGTSPSELSDPPTVTKLGKSVHLEWERVADDGYFDSTSFYEYEVKRRASGSSTPWESVSSLTPLPLRVPFFVDPAPPPGSWEYEVSVVDTSGNSSGMPVVTTVVASNPFAPSVPGGVFGSTGPGALEASIGWDAVPEDDPLNLTDIEYVVYQWDGNGWEPQPPVAEGATRLTLSVLQGVEDQPLRLAVRAKDMNGNQSALSEPVLVWPALSDVTLGIPEPINGARATATSTTDMSVLVVAPHSAQWYRRLEGQAGLYYLRSGEPTTAFKDHDLVPCRAYLYRATTVKDPQELDGVKISSGSESGINEPRWVDRYVEAAAPVESVGASTQVNLYWDGDLISCEAEEEVYFRVVGYFLMRQDPGGNIVQINNPDTQAFPNGDWPFGAAYDTTAPNTWEIYRYWVEPILENLLVTEANPAEASGPSFSRGPRGKYVCASVDVGVYPDISYCLWGDPLAPGGGSSADGERPPQEPIIRKITEPDPTVGTLRLEEEGHSWRVARMQPQFSQQRIEGYSSMEAKQRSQRSWAESDYAITGSGGPAGSPDARGVTLAFLHVDHLGTTRVASDSNGAILARTAALPFGELLESSPSGPRDFAGHARDGETIYMMARYYSPTLARFSSSDPVSGKIRAVGSLNRYSYVLNNPLILVDPFGKSGWLARHLAARQKAAQPIEGAMNAELGGMVENTRETYFELKNGENSVSLEAGLVDIEVEGEHGVVEAEGATVTLEAKNETEPGKVDVGASGEIVGARGQATGQLEGELAGASVGVEVEGFVGRLGAELQRGLTGGVPTAKVGAKAEAILVRVEKEVSARAGSLRLTVSGSVGVGAGGYGEVQAGTVDARKRTILSAKFRLGAGLLGGGGVKITWE